MSDEQAQYSVEFQQDFARWRSDPFTKAWIELIAGQIARARVAENHVSKTAEEKAFASERNAGREEVLVMLTNLGVGSGTQTMMDQETSYAEEF